MWVYLPDPQRLDGPMPELPRLPHRVTPYRMVHISTVLGCTIDDGIVGASWILHTALSSIKALGGETQASMHDKAKTFQSPFPTGFRMVPHAPQNSGPYKLLQ